MSTPDTEPARLLFVVSGGMLAPLVPSWIHMLRESLSCDVRVVVTADAAALATERALSVYSGNPVLGPERSWSQHEGLEHVNAAGWAQCAVVAPATMNFCAKLAAGLGDDLACSTVHSLRCPTFLVPSIPPGAVGKPVTLRVMNTLREDGFTILDQSDTEGDGPLDDLVTGLLGVGMRPAARLEATPEKGEQVAPVRERMFAARALAAGRAADEGTKIS